MKSNHKGQNYSKERWSELGKEGGKTSGLVRRERVIEKYIKIGHEKGLYEAVRIAVSESWQRGYASRIKWERLNEGRNKV